MEDILRDVYEDKISNINTLGILHIEHNYERITNIELFDSIILVILKKVTGEDQRQINHYECDGKKIVLYVLDEEQLHQRLNQHSNSPLIRWILEGKIIFDRKQYVLSLKIDLRDFPFRERMERIGIEFAKLVFSYLNGKHHFEQRQLLEAYTYAIQSLKRLGKLTVIENGVHPRFVMWEKIKQMEPQIYKLYEELIKSNEPLEKRLELLFLATDFLVHSKTSIGTKHFLSVLQDQLVWRFQEISSHPKLKNYDRYLSMFLKYLLDKGIISPVKLGAQNDTYKELCYQSKKNQFYC